MGSIENIWLKSARGGPMEPVQQVACKAGAGLEGNANQGGERQVTMIDQERWARLEEDAGTKLDPIIRRANVLVRGLTLENTAGRILRLGNCRILIHGETWPCHQMDAAHAGLKDLMVPHWGGGAYGEVLDDGRVAVGDDVAWEQ